MLSKDRKSWSKGVRGAGGGGEGQGILKDRAIGVVLTELAQPELCWGQRGGGTDTGGKHE